VQKIGVPRVNGVLAVSRAFGDLALQPFVSALPEISEARLTSKAEEEFLIIASDGLWDVVSNQAAVDIASQCMKADGHCESAAKVLVQTAASRGSTDNTTVVVVDISGIRKMVC